MPGRVHFFAEGIEGVQTKLQKGGVGLVLHAEGLQTLGKIAAQGKVGNVRTQSGKGLDHAGLVHRPFAPVAEEGHLRIGELLGGGGGFAALAQRAPGLGRDFPVGGGKEGEHPVGLLVPYLPQHKGLCGVEHNMYVSVPGAGHIPRFPFILIVFRPAFALHALVEHIAERIPGLRKGPPDCVCLQIDHLSRR